MFAPDAGSAGVVGVAVSLAFVGVVAGVWRKSPPKSFFMAVVYLDVGPFKLVGRHRVMVLQRACPNEHDMLTTTGIVYGIV